MHGHYGHVRPGGSTFWWVSTLECIFIRVKPTKGTSLVISASFEPLHDFLRRFVQAVRESQKRRIKKKKLKKVDKRYISHIWGEATVNTIATKIGLFRGFGDVINPTNFRVHRFNRFGATDGQSWGLP